MIGRNNVIYMAVRRGIPLAASVVPPDDTDSRPTAPSSEIRQSLRRDPDSCAAALQRLYELLDAMVAWRVSFANGTEGERALSAIGRAKVLEVRTILDTSIHNIKSAIDDVERQRPEQ